MERDELMRKALAASVFFNILGASLFAFPESLGRIAALPLPVPRVYSWSLTYLVLLFAGTYAWLARQPVIHRPLVGFAALGKAGFFLTVLLCWFGGEVALQTVLIASGDLAFALLFGWWLLGDSPARGTAAHPQT